jgi:hypothetical protein
VQSPEPGPRSFLLRALPESGPDGTTWRGYIVGLPDGTEVYFERLSQIPEIILELLADQAPKRSGAA